MSVFESDLWPVCENELVGMLAEPGRAYHNFSHIEDCLNQLAEIPDLCSEDKELLALAIWFHDAIYDPTRSDNETESAAFASLWLERLNVDPIACEIVVNLIEITQHNLEPKTENQKRMIDIDLSILGMEPARYEAYASAVRTEYGHVPDADYRSGRSIVLRRFLDRDHIFQTGFFREKYEACARENLELEIKRLAEASN